MPEWTTELETFRGFHIYLLVEWAIQVRCFDIELTEFEVIGGCEAKDRPDGVPACDRSECEGEVLPGNLSEALCDEAGFEASDVSAFVVFDVQNPFAQNGFAAGGEGIDFFIYALSSEGLEFLMHRWEPLRPIMRPFCLHNQQGVFRVVVFDVVDDRLWCGESIDGGGGGRFVVQWDRYLFIVEIEELLDDGVGIDKVGVLCGEGRRAFRMSRVSIPVKYVFECGYGWTRTAVLYAPGVMFHVTEDPAWVGLHRGL